jgi:hypothetical protein
MICASPHVFIGLCLLIVDMLVGSSYNFKDDLRVNTHSQVDLLVIYVNYYSMWSPRWKAMCFPMHVFIIAMSLKVVINVINGQTWDKATTQSWSLNKFYSTHGLPIHIDQVFLGKVVIFGYVVVDILGCDH